MIPSAVAREARANLLDYLQTTYGLNDERLEAGLLEFLRGPDGLFRGPYVDVRLPFRTAREDRRIPLEVRPGFTPYEHQMRAFERLHVERGHQPQHTLVTTGTGSGKTECFLYPLLDHCLRERKAGREGVKAILLYPMNALATDQARRFAKELWDDERLKENQVSAGLYVGGKGSHKIPDREHLVDDRALLRQSPPDILLTNYKMLDFLLLRPEDQTLWRHNRPETLRFLVLDELHTYDGAQGSDVACLIRRLKARLEVPPGGLCCVGTSATIGEADEESKRRLTDFAGEIFEERFFSGSVITEDRLGPDEALGKARDHGGHPNNEDRPALETSGRGLAEWLSAQRALWFENPEALKDRVALGRSLKRHEFLHQMLRVLRGRSCSLAELGEGLAARVEWFAELNAGERELVLDSFLGLISHARKREGEVGEGEVVLPEDIETRPIVPFLQVQLQLWMREVRGLQRILEKPAAFEWLSEKAGGAIETAADPEDRDVGLASLPMIRCRDCGVSGLASVQHEGEARLRDDREKRQIGRAWLERSTRARLVMLGHGGAEKDEQFYLCPVCLALTDESGCKCLDDQTPSPLPIRLYREMTDDNHPRFKPVCPECESEDGLLFLGSRSSSLMSVAVSHLFQTEYNEDHKLLAFVDSVQDASHRAGFFGARTYRFNLRTQIQDLLEDNGGTLMLKGVGGLLLKRTSERLGSEALAFPALLPEDLRQHPRYERFLDREGKGEHPELRELLVRRLEQEVTFEFGFSVRAGRSLEKTGCSTLRIPLGSLDSVVDDLHMMASEEGWFGILLVERDALWLFVAGILQRLRLRGGIHHPNLDRYVSEGGDRFMLSRLRMPDGPIFAPDAVLPRFLQATRPTGGKRSAFDSYVPSSADRPNWYTDWASRVLGIEQSSPSIRDLIENALRLLSRAEIVKGVTLASNRTIWGLEPRSLEIVDSMRQLECRECKQPMRVASDEAGRWEGQPCTFFRCSGQFGEAVEAPESFYTRIFRSGRLARVFPEEHTGLLGRETREGIEDRFKQDPPRPDGPNLLVCTPTLEMGIDIGDLSAVMLCSVPPTTSNYLQRVGRAGRSTGNALCLTTATTRPHDLYFHADPQAMMAGTVEPPGCFLDAPEMLKRQFVAHAMDHWARQETEVREIPRKASAVLAQGAKFPSRFLDYLDGEVSELVEDFLERFEEGSLSEQAREDLRIFALGGNARVRIEGAFADIKKERARIKRQREKTQKEREKHEADSDLGPEELERLLRELRDSERVLERLARELGDRYPLNVLTDAGVLPNYAFPEPGVELESVVVAGDGNQRTYSIHSYLRPASAAIRELAPFNSFYAEGRRVEVDEIDLGSHTQPLLEAWRFCAACSHSEREDQELGEPEPACPSCGDTQWADVDQRRRMVYFRRSRSLSGRLQAATADDGEERTRKRYTTLDLIDVQPENCQGARIIESIPFGFELLKCLVLREVNFGLEGREDKDVAGTRVPSGFLVCRDCGRVKPEEPPGPIRHQPQCRSRNNKNERVEQVHLYREVQSEAIRMLLPVAELDLDSQRASFRAALQLGLRRRYGGRAPHLQTKQVSEPATGGGHRNYLVLFDSVPGGTGFLADLWREDRLFDVLDLALKALEACPCQREGKDGCYRCLFAYQSQRDLTVTSSAAARATLRTILEARGKAEDKETLSEVSMASVLDSELEEKFLRALLHRVRRVGSVRQYLENGQKRWEITLAESAWAIAPQVDVGPAQGVGKASRPDFVLTPLRPGMDTRRVAVFCDGFAYHVQPERSRSRIGDDLEKRRALIESASFLVWSVTWKDVEDMENGADFLEKPLLHASVSKLAASRLEQWGLPRPELQAVSSGAQLFRWIQDPDDQRWRGECLALGAVAAVGRQALRSSDRQALNTSLREEEAAIGDTPTPEPVSASTGHFSQFNKRPFSATLVSMPTQSAMESSVPVAADWVLRLYDDQASRNAKGYEGDWRRFLQALNLMQFTEHMHISSTELLSGGVSNYPDPTEIDDGGAGLAAEISTPVELAALDLQGQELVIAQQVLEDTGLLPEPQYEYPPTGRTTAQADLAWPEALVAYVDPASGFTDTERDAMRAGGWTLFGPETGTEAIVGTIREAMRTGDE